MLLLNDIPVPHFYFPGGEIQIRLPQEISTEEVTLTWLPKNPSDVMLLMMTVNALKHRGIFDINLNCLYLPYGRQDRVCSDGEAFSLEVICSMLETLKLTVIRFWDLHNWDVTSELFSNHYLFEIEPVDIFERYRILDDFDLYETKLCAPDKGASRKVQKIEDKFQLGTSVLCKKERDKETGIIQELKIDDHYSSPDDYIILVVDDICDGGRTFLELAKLLKDNGANDLCLYVTHGIFSSGVDELLKHYKHIYCHHTFHPLLNDHENLTVLRKFDVY